MPGLIRDPASPLDPGFRRDDTANSELQNIEQEMPNVQAKYRLSGVASGGAWLRSAGFYIISSMPYL